MKLATSGWVFNALKKWPRGRIRRGENPFEMATAAEFFVKFTHGLAFFGWPERTTRNE